MREIFEDIQSRESLDPSEAARRNMRARRRRFYVDAQVCEEGAGAAITLDGRAIRTPARNKLSAPSTALAEAIAAEWRRQGEFIDPATMPLTRLANTIIDGVAQAPDEVAGEVANYLRSDLLCYRATSPRGLVAREAAHWDPIILWARDVLGTRFVVGRGVVHVIQPDDVIAAASAAIPRDFWRLGAVHSITTLTGSALLALAVAHERITAEAAWAAGHVDEDWNMEFWGRDELALKRREYRLGEMTAAANVLAALREGSGPGAR
jgi:chaperone required for assembly of F1-ATPase